MKLSVVIPTYNEEKRLPSTLNAVSYYLDAHYPDHEILVVDDGSRDRTVTVAEEFSRMHPRVKVIANRQNRGKGAVVQQGLREARGEWRLYMDADHSTDISELTHLEPLAESKAAVLVSSRYLPASKITGKQPWVRVVVSRISNILIRIFAVRGIHDTQNGFKLLRADAAEAVLPYLLLRRWAFDVELLFVARRLNFVIREFPVAWKNAAGSKLSVVHDMRNTAGEFARFLWNRLRGRYPMGTVRESKTLGR